MSKHQIFLIHGMGNYEPGWSMKLQEEIRATFAQYKKVDALSYIDRFDLVEVLYDDVFEKWRKMWREDAAQAAAAATQLKLDPGVATKLISLAQGPTRDSFFQTHVLDPVMYRFLTQFQEEVNQSLRRQILDRLNAFPRGQLPRWSAVAHSLGTAVLHNTLHAMFTHPVDGVLLGDAYMPAYLFMIANTGKVLWNKGGDFYASRVKPHPVDTMGLCLRYCTFDHDLDPIPDVDRFDPPPSWFPPDVRKDDIYADVRIPKGDLQDFNVHGLAHYWSHPDVHVEIISSLLDIADIIPQVERAQQLKKWRAKGLKATAKAKVQSELQQLLAQSTSQWAAVVQRLFEFREKAKKLGLDPRDGES